MTKTIYSTFKKRMYIFSFFYSVHIDVSFFSIFTYMNYYIIYYLNYYFYKLFKLVEFCIHKYFPNFSQVLYTVLIENKA